MRKPNQFTPLLSSIFLLGISACASSSTDASSLSDNTLEEIKQVIAPWVSDTAPGLAVAISLNDEIVFAQGAGLANLEHKLPITPESVFQVASVSKQFTAFAALLLVSEGKIDLDTDIREYLPELPKMDSTVTVRQLLDHASGLRERNTLAAMAGWMADDIHTEEQSLELIMRQRGSNFSAGEKIEYSNTGYALLAHLVARVSDQPFQTFMEKRIFEPLEMHQTRFPNDRNDLIPARAASYYPAGDGFKNVIVSSTSFGSSGLYTSVIDLLKWAENFETQRVGNPMVFELMEERFQARNGDEATFAKGQELRVHQGVETWSHGGTGSGYRSFLLRVPSKDLEIAVVSNRTDFEKADFAFNMLDVLLAADPNFVPEEPASWNPATKEQLLSYEGDYEIQPGSFFSIRAHSEGVTFASLGSSHEGLPPLTQIGPREFLLSANPERALIFNEPIENQSPSLDYRIAQDGAIIAPRVELKPFDADSVDLNDYIGRCESEELATYYTLSIENNVLFLKHARLPIFPATPYQEDTFAGQGPLSKLEFKRDASGTVIGFHASSPLANGVWFSCSKEHAQ